MKRNLFGIFAFAMILALTINFLPAQTHPVRAVSPDIVISQVYGGGGNSGATYKNDFIELYNRGTTTVSLAGWSLQYASATGTGNFGANSGQLTELSGSIAPGQYWLVQESGGTDGIPIPTPNVTDGTPINMSGTAGKVALVNTTASLGCNGGSTSCSPTQLARIIDLVGYGTANFFEGSGAAPALNNTTAAFRKSNGAQDTDVNSADFTAGPPNPRNTPPPDVAPSVTNTVPMDGASGVSLSSNISVTFSENVNVTTAWFNLTCSLSGSHTATFSGGPTIFVLDPGVDFVDGDNCTLTVLASQVTDQDNNDPPDNMTVNFTVGFSTGDICLAPFTPIYNIQGSGPVAAITGAVTTQGVVVGDFQNNASPDNGNLNGFNIQDTLGDGDPATSDGIFIYAPSGMDVNNGDVVRVTGSVSEFNGLTEITASQILPCGTGSVPPTGISLPVPSLDAFEAYEGMLVTFTQGLYISEYFNFDRYGEIVLTSQRHLTPTAEFEPGPPSIQAAQNFLLDKITLDDGRSVQNPDPAIHPNGNVFDLTNLFRGGDILQNVTGVMDFSFNLYRIQPTQGADYFPANPRPVEPQDTGGSLTVVSMNTLNYFSTIDRGTSYWICGPAQNQECRGADTPEEFARQRAKVIAAITAMNADVIGLLEIENNIYDEALQDLVDGLNAVNGAGTYDYIHTGVIGTDAIKVAFIYKPASVALVGNYAILNSAVDPRFIDTKNRPVLAQTFMDNATGGIFTAAINHFKSKGSACNDVGDPDLGDGAGNCNITRRLAAQALVDWLAADPTGSGDSDFLILGDLNSYDHEDPIDAIKAGPDDILDSADDYTDLVFQFQGEDAYSYVFDGQLGYLDYGLASANLAGQVTGVADWHVNADEPDLIDYEMTFKLPAQDAIFAPDPYRYSDHDPIIIGLDVRDEIAPTFEEVSVSPDSLWPANHKYVDVVATVVVSDNFDPDPVVTLVSITSSEPDNGLGDGDTADDIVILDDFHFKLRAERSGADQTGRIYTITYMVTDQSGNFTIQEVTVSVPHSKQK